MMIEKMNPFKQIIETIKAFVDTDKFYRLRRQSTGSKFVVALIIGIIASCFIFLLGGFRFAQNKFWDEFMDEVPNFVYSNGQLICEETYYGQSQDVYFVLDTDVDAWTLAGYSTDTQGTDVTGKMNEIMKISGITDIMFVSRTNMIMIRGVGISPNYQEEKIATLFEVFGIQSLSKEQVRSGYKSVIMKIAAILFFVGIPVQIIRLFFDALLWSILALVINAVKRKTEDFATLYWISFYIQGVFMMISTLAHSLFTFKSLPLTMVFIIIYVVYMNIILNHGAPVEEISAANGAPVTDFGAVEDDFDRFMEQEKEVPAPEMKSAFDIDYNRDENSGAETKTSGLSIKKDD